MKKVLNKLMVLATVSCAVVASEIAIVNTNVLLIKKAPNDASLKLGYYNMNNLIEVTKVDDTWSKVKLGYVKSAYIIKQNDLPVSLKQEEVDFNKNVIQVIGYNITAANVLMNVKKQLRNENNLYVRTSGQFMVVYLANFDSYAKAVSKLNEIKEHYPSAFIRKLKPLEEKISLGNERINKEIKTNDEADKKLAIMEKAKLLKIKKEKEQRIKEQKELENVIQLKKEDDLRFTGLENSILLKDNSKNEEERKRLEKLKKIEAEKLAKLEKEKEKEKKLKIQKENEQKELLKEKQALANKLLLLEKEAQQKKLLQEKKDLANRLALLQKEEMLKEEMLQKEQVNEQKRLKKEKEDLAKSLALLEKEKEEEKIKLQNENLELANKLAKLEKEAIAVKEKAKQKELEEEKQKKEKKKDSNFNYLLENMLLGL